MKTIFLTLALIGFGALLAATDPASAQAAAETAPAAKAKAEPKPTPDAAVPADQIAPSVKRAEQWLQNLKTARARFLMTASNGTQLIGTFYLDRPGKLRFDYDPPVEDFVVADGIFIYFYDAKLGEQSNAPIGQTLADFLLRDNIKLSGDVKVDSVTNSGGLLQLKLVQSADSGAGSLTLGFVQEPFQLKKWRVVDPQGQVSEVELFQLQTGVQLNREMFAYHDPKKNPNRLND